MVCGRFAGDILSERVRSTSPGFDLVLRYWDIYDMEELFEELFLEYFNDEDVSLANNKSVLRSLFLEDKKYRELIFTREYTKKNSLFATLLEADELSYYWDFIVEQRGLSKHNAELLKSVVGKELSSYVNDENIYRRYYQKIEKNKKGIRT